MSQPIRNTEDLDRAAASGGSSLYPDRLKILIGSASCGVALGREKSRLRPSRPCANCTSTPSSAAPVASASARRAAVRPDAAQWPAAELWPNDGPEDPPATESLCRGKPAAGMGAGPLQQRRTPFDARDSPISGRPERSRQCARVVHARFLPPAEESHSAELRLDRSAVPRRSHRPRRLSRRHPRDHPDDAGRGHRGGGPVRAARPRRGRFPHRPEVAIRPPGPGRFEIRRLQRR